MTIDKLASVEEIVKSLRSPLVRLHYLFLSWILPKFTDVNKYFQSSGVVITEVHEKMRVLFQEILMAYLDPRYVQQKNFSTIELRNERYFLRDEQIYLGTRVLSQMSKQEISQNKNLLRDFYSSVREFLITAASEIRDRYDFNNTFLTYMSIFSYKKSRDMNVHISFPSMVPVLSLVPRIKAFFNDQEIQAIDDEWRKLPLVELPDDVTSIKSTESFWAKLMDIQNEEEEFIFRTLTKFVFYLFSLPHANADAER